MTQPVQYARKLGVFDATMLVIGGIIGSGIFLNPAVVAQRVGSAGLTVAAWAIGGVVALAGAFCFAELGARKPEAGGGYVYLRDALGPVPAFLYGWTELLVINSGGIAAGAATFARYTMSFLTPGDEGTWLAITAIAFLTATNYLGIKLGSVVQNVFTVLKILALAGLIIVGLLVPEIPVTGGTATPSPLATGGSTLGLLGAALIPVLFAYGGWQSTNFVAGELKEPRRDLPRALVLGVLCVAAIYILANVTYLKVLGVTGLAGSTAPASDVMRMAFGPVGSAVTAVGIAVSTFGFLNLAILSAPRIYQAMAADGLFFGRAARLDPRFRVPGVALLIQGAWAILLLGTKTFGQLLDYVVFGNWIFFGLTAATLFLYRRRESASEAGDATRFRTPWYPWLPAFFVAAAIATVVSIVASNPRNAALGGTIILAGVPAYWLWKRRVVRSTQ